MIIWIMGLNGAGKSSVARELEQLLGIRKYESIVLDGNHLREVLDQNSYDRASRIALGIRYAQLANTLSEHSHKVVIIAANGMLKEVCEYNRSHLREYYEIFLDVPLCVRKSRDTSGIFARFEKGLEHNVGGLDMEVDIPNAHLHIAYEKNHSPKDIAHIIDNFIHQDKNKEVKLSPHQNILGTKATTLINLSSCLQYGKILPLWTLSKADFIESQKQNNETFAHLCSELEAYRQAYGGNFIVRSSASTEDRQEGSNAGAFESVANVCLDCSYSALKKAIDFVFNSYNKESLKQDGVSESKDVKNSEIVLIQPMLENILCAGVIFNTHPKTNAPYYIVEYALHSTNEVTSGGGKTQSFYAAWNVQEDCISDEYAREAIKLIREIEMYIPNTALDVEFALSTDGIYCLQARQLVLSEHKQYPSHHTQLALLRDKIDKILQPHPYLYGDRGILGVMPDWNPAEIIGLHPRPLAFSLYAWLITDSLYSLERARYGYRDVSTSPLIYNLHGKPYVDVRASFNSLLPKDLGETLSRKLMNYYLQRLRENPHLHDKVEFEILFESYYFDTPMRLQILLDYGFSGEEIEHISHCLKGITNAYFTHRIYEEDVRKVELLSKRHEKIIHFNMPLLEKIYWLLQDCKTYGTAPFVGLARMGFVAMGFLNALVKEGILTQIQKDSFISSLECITSHFTADLSTLSKTEFLRKYGHLRPGTYDILSPRYDECFELYFQTKPTQKPPKETFSLSLHQMRAIDSLLKEHEIQSDVLMFFDFIATGIKARESAKFEFSKNLSLVLSLLSEVGGEYGLSKEDMSYCDIGVIFKAYGTSNNLERLILESIEYGKSTYLLQQAIILPPLIMQGKDVESFCMSTSMPNFITQKRVCAPVVRLDCEFIPKLSGAIVCISRADPGFDWIFSHGIAGFITEFGGANSHMAIRANELGVPAAIGCGEKFEKLASAKMLDLDCANAKVEIV